MALNPLAPVENHDLTGRRNPDTAPQPVFSRELGMFLSCLPDLSKRSVEESRGVAWDCNCGTGDLAVILGRDCGWRVVGTDPSSNKIQRAEEIERENLEAGGTIRPGLTYRCAFPDSSGLADGTVGLVIAHQAHTYELPAFYEEVRRVAWRRHRRTWLRSYECK
jgi:hypothetical protein